MPDTPTPRPHATVTDAVAAAAAARVDTEASGDRAIATYRTLMRGDATRDDRSAHVIAALTAAGLTGTVTPLPFPGLCDSETGERDEAKWGRTFTTQRLAVLGCFAEGQSYTETARSLHLNVSTVKSHAGNLYRIFGVASKVEAVMMAVRYGVIPTPAPAVAPTPRRRRRPASEAASE
jgi:DNA-binding NarL/FixJ family response regulator